MITVEPEIWERFQKAFPGQASGFCNEALRLKIKSFEGSSSGIDYQLLLIKKQELEKNYDDLSLKLNDINSELLFQEEEARKSEEERLMDEKERIEAKHRCPACGNMFIPSEKTIKVGVHNYCRTCFMTDHPLLVAALKDERNRRNETS